MVKFKIWDHIKCATKKRTIIKFLALFFVDVLFTSYLSEWVARNVLTSRPSRRGCAPDVNPSVLNRNKNRFVNSSINDVLCKGGFKGFVMTVLKQRDDSGRGSLIVQNCVTSFFVNSITNVILEVVHK